MTRTIVSLAALAALAGAADAERIDSSSHFNNDGSQYTESCVTYDYAVDGKSGTVCRKGPTYVPKSAWHCSLGDDSAVCRNDTTGERRIYNGDSTFEEGEK